MIVGISKNSDLKKDMYDKGGTKFTRLTYAIEGKGAGPLVESSPNADKVYNDLYPIKARVEDTARVGHMLITKNGLRWEGHMATLNTIQNQRVVAQAQKYNGDGKALAASVLTSIGKSLITGAMTTAAVLGQTAVAGTGVHFTPYIGRAYVEPTGTDEKFVPKLKSGNIFVGADQISSGVGVGISRPSKMGDGMTPEIKDVHSKTAIGSVERYKNIKETGWSEIGGKNYGKDLSKDKYENSTLRDLGLEKIEGGEEERTEYIGSEVERRTQKGYQGDEINPKNIYSDENAYKFGNGTSGSRDVRDGKILYGQSKDGKNNYYKAPILPEKIEDLTKTPGNLEVSGLIPFYISSITPDRRVNCVFEANLDSYSDDFTGNWDGIQYVGRADKFHVYSGFDRQISFAFKVVAKSQDNLIPIYNSLNYLAGTTAPTYDEGQTFMRGTLACLRIGDILIDQIGIFTKVGFKWDVDVPWEVDEHDDTIRVPHMLTVNVSFTPIHSFVPTADSVFFGNKISR